MNNKIVRIVDIGRGPQIEGHRLTVMDVFYYLHRGHDFDFIHRAMPTLTREQFDAVAAYVKEHHDELVEEDRYCADILVQISSVHEALRGVGQALLRNHLRNCVTATLKKGQPAESEARSANQAESAPISASESFSPGISKVVTSSQTFVWLLIHTRVSSTSANRPPHRLR